MFENRVLRKKFEHKRGEVTGKWKRVRNEELYDTVLLTKHYASDQSRRMSWARHITRMWERKGAYRVSAGKFEAKKQHGKLCLRWEDCMQMDLQEIGWHGIWLRMGQVADCCECGNETPSSLTLWPWKWTFKL